ncbi:hypothetical protein ACLI1A_07015 [Flavobacterium sp. RHBU_3]|uniref:hypothetical protein n=1 Tax=Flavobacterium sp. RHBU_3 TaxID=3391184 RepID=UPI0039846C89
MKKNTIKLGVLTALLAGGVIVVSYASGNKLFSGHKEIQAQEYKTQLMYVEVANEDAQAGFDLEHNISGKQDDTKVGWEYFDGLYKPSLSATAKQQLAYAILVKKDLIGAVKNNPDDANNVAALKKYVGVLAETKYTGFTALYYALDALEAAGETEFVHKTAQVVYGYGKNESWHTDVIKGGVSTVGKQDYYNKVVSDFTFVDKIKLM